MEETTLRLLRYLMRTGRLAEVRADNLLNDVNLTMTELIALCQIRHADGQLSLSALAQCMAFVKSNATQVIDRMEADDLVRRVLSAEDRRSKLIEVTDEGLRARQTGLRTLEPLAEKLQVLTPDEQAQLLHLLEKLGEALA